MVPARLVNRNNTSQSSPFGAFVLKHFSKWACFLTPTDNYEVQ